MQGPRQLYVLSFRGWPISGHTRFEGANAKMSEYSAERQRDMKITVVWVED
jgi:hypothetical protein